MPLGRRRSGLPVVMRKSGRTRALPKRLEKLLTSR